MNNYNYLNFAVWRDFNGKEYLVKARKGYFASDAFIESDKAFSQIIGEKFGGIFGDDGAVATCSRRNIRRLTSDEEFEDLYAKACECFKFLIEFQKEFDKEVKKLPIKKEIILCNSWSIDEVRYIHIKRPDCTVEDLVKSIIASEN